MGTRRVELTSMTFKIVCGMDEQKSFSKPGYRHFMCEDIRHIGRDMTQNGIFGNGKFFCPSLPFWTIFCQSFSPITGFKMLFDHGNLGIDTSYVDISVILLVKK